MKSLKQYIKETVLMTAAVSSGFACTSCGDMLDTKPQGQFTAGQIGEDEASDLMTAAYATLLCHYFGNNESFAGPINNWVIDLRSDDALKGGDGVTMEGYMHQLEIGNVQSDNDVINFKWRNNYFSISRCNTAIKAILAAGSLSESAKAAYVSEMKTLRAYYYFDMFRLFKKFPYFDETVANPSQCRADEYSRDQIAGFIRQDLRDAYDNLPSGQ
ncbi:MAG: RagB/SusD family nutrient uptake outer membrane protein [Muribaculaceae bacterium]|nr:RagB/SusD family nutrient uptake outer membrane protein [Muribaculaceae bacterium]